MKTATEILIIVILLCFVLCIEGYGAEKAGQQPTNIQTAPQSQSAVAASNCPCPPGWTLIAPCKPNQYRCKVAPPTPWPCDTANSYIWSYDPNKCCEAGCVKGGGPSPDPPPAHFSPTLSH
jgi:hypothetical protein